ncbi:MAG TPA: hypothetical protein V6D12_20390 [Candidatus Obscuribacterales bacterium]
MDTTKQIYELVKQWCDNVDSSQGSEALRQIATITGCIPQIPVQWTEHEGKCVVRWLQKNHPNAYLWAMSQRWVGHPAIVWGSQNCLKRTSSLQVIGSR